MTQVIWLLSCGHWCRGIQGEVGKNTRCAVCARPVEIVGEASPHQLALTGRSAS